LGAPRDDRELVVSYGVPQSKPYRYSDEDEFTRIFGSAALMAMAVALFAPRLSGQSAIDRFARQHKAAGPDETAAIEALRRSRFPPAEP
jgi:hypothetical protein